MSIEDRIRERVLAELDLTENLSDVQILEEIRREICLEGKRCALSYDRRKELERHIFHSLRRLDILQDFLEDEDITEIMVNGPSCIFLERQGRIERSKRQFYSAEKLQDVIQQIASTQNQIISETNPILDTRIPEFGARVNIVMSPIAIGSPVLTIRKFPREPITMERLLEYGSLSVEMEEFLRDAVYAGYNIFISGETSSGKTTFLNALTEFIPSDARVITIEDSAELQVRGIENLVRMESRNKTMEGKLEVTIRDLVKSSLRMRPDRIIVGECRGGEALEMLSAMNTGHDGSLSTGHANSAKDMISRLETMCLMAMDLPIPAVRQQIASAIDLFVHLGRLRDRKRRVLEIAEVVGMENGEVKLHSLYEYEGGEKGWRQVGRLERLQKMERAGIDLTKKNYEIDPAKRTY
ncbi:MAG: ATPase, T2SS/T4P/T4SS family [Lachnospiraceae bacterium]|nr:CpaF family protein [Lachnospiraceae bacterium]MDY3301702.1 ATPase, T2SS/T4P/T4SS family [Lachnospiraceae bacterium]